MDDVPAAIQDSMPKPLVPDHRMQALNADDKRPQPQPYANDSIGFNALLAGPTPTDENGQPGKSLDPFQHPYVQEEKGASQYFASNNGDLGQPQATVAGPTAGNL